MLKHDELGFIRLIMQQLLCSCPSNVWRQLGCSGDLAPTQEILAPLGRGCGHGFSS